MPTVMKISHILIVPLAAILICFPSDNKVSFAEEFFSSSAQVPKQNQFDSMKTAISQLIEENKKLEVEYSLIAEEFQNLVDQLMERKQEVEALRQKSGLVENESGETAQPVLPPGGDPNDILVLENRINLLKTRLGNLEEQNHARKMQIESLKYQKGELEIDVKMKNFIQSDNDKRKTNHLEALKADIQEILDQEKVAVNRIAEIEEQKQMYPARIDELQRTNKELQSKILELEKQRDFKKRENANLRDKKLLEELLTERAMSVKQEEKAKLEKTLQDLESEYNKLDQQVSNKLQTNGQNHAMMKSLIQVDKENQDLRDRIVALKEKVRQINK